jgi:hypothetical protein
MKQQAILLQKAQDKKEERLRLLEELYIKFAGKSKHWLNKKFGTLNIHRITSILNDSWEKSHWFTNRLALKEARKSAVKKIQIQEYHAEHKKKHNKFQKNPDKKFNKPQIQQVHTGPDQGTGQA